MGHIRGFEEDLGQLEGFDLDSFRPEIVEGAIALLEVDVDGVPHILAGTRATGPEPGALRVYLRDLLV